MHQIDKFKSAYRFYLKSCDKHGIDIRIEFSEFINTITLDQMEMMAQAASSR